MPEYKINQLILAECRKFRYLLGIVFIIQKYYKDSFFSHYHFSTYVVVSVNVQYDLNIPTQNFSLR